MVDKTRRWGWTQPSCRPCFTLANPGKEPHRARDVQVEVCVECGRKTYDGIYVRIDPAKANYPTMVE